MSDSGRKPDAVFFRTNNGSEPVREWLLSLPKEERKAIGDDVLRVQYGWPIGKPLVGNLGDGLWEVRSSLGRRIARLIFALKATQWCSFTGSSKDTKDAAT
jgi:phage-related protein